MRELLGEYINGNYRVQIFDDGTKIRITDDNEFIPAFAECNDVKITDKCDGGCSFCYEGCTASGRHGDILNYDFLETLHPYTEMAINGNDLTHPDLIEFLYKVKAKNVFVNMTVNQIHFEKCQEMIKTLIDEKLIYGLGVSLREPTDEFIELIKQYPNAVIHTINGIITKEQLDKLANHNLKILVLGYKQLKRGIDYYEKEQAEILERQAWLKDNLDEYTAKFNLISFDNLALKQLEVKRLLTDEEWDEFFMGEDSEFTFYIDMVQGRFSKNSISRDEDRYDIGDLSMDEMFEKIRLRKVK